MPFYVYAEDRPDVADQLTELSEEHWSYMDRFDSRLMLRGPTVSDDGEEHTGSVHVVDLADRAAAERFGREEPFWKAGLYRDLTVVAADVLLNRGPEAGVTYTLVAAQWPLSVRATGDPASDDAEQQGLWGTEPDSRFVFVAALTDDEGTGTTGVVAAVRALPDEARGLVRPFAERLAGGRPAAFTAQRWERGGRH
ncbi:MULTISPECIES: YciI family protein [Streptomyces]|uniref:YciI family protein n=1 Tax=Streptomyces TaxID=1883 RepID=UPI0028B23664|nr:MULTISPECIES: YciI family protein [Streptomyces]MDX3605211.1 YciI family protein [Streptomyces sp. FL06-04B]MDX3736078.1 YciI family protein [Streptomyces sp. ID01-15D]